MKKLVENWALKRRRGIIITNKDAALVPDTFQDYSNIPVYDMMSLEDIPLADVLKTPSSIVLQIKERYYAFDRHVLIDYMESKRMFINDVIGYIFETPYRQYISAADMSLVCSDVFRIYELYDESRVPFKDGMVSIYNVMPLTLIQCLDAMIIA